MLKLVKKFFNNFFRKKIVITILGLIIIVLISIPLAKNLSKQYNINKEIKKLDQEIIESKNKNINIKELVNYMESPQFVDEKARLNLDYKKEGEEVVVIKNKEADSGNKPLYGNNMDDAGKNKKTNNPQRWLSYFLRK